MSFQFKSSKLSAFVLALVVGAATFASGPAFAEGPRRALNMFGDMVDTMAGIAAEQEAAREAAPKCWTEKRTTKSAGKTVIKTVKVCE